MGDGQTTRGGPQRSVRWFRKDDLPGFVHRSTLAAAGWSREDLMERPIVGMLNTWSDINPCNLNLRTLAEEVRTGILEAGGIPFEVPLMSLSENIIKPTSFPFRNLLAMDAEECIRAYPFDSVVLLGGCDKTQPALLMGAASANVPMIFLTSGPATPRSRTGGHLATATGVWRFVDELRAGELSKSNFAAFERSIMGTPGHCAEMGTASSMSAICEALGLALSGSSLVPAVDRHRNRIAREVGHHSVRMAAEGTPRPDEILDERAFDNAIALLCAVGGSTNVIIHLLALAGRVGVPLSLDRFDEIGRRVPLIANVQPAGEHLTEQLMAAGGVPALLKRLKPFLHLDAPTVEGRTIGQIIDTAEIVDPDVIRPLDEPVKPGETLVVVRGNLAPDGAVIKACAAEIADKIPLVILSNAMNEQIHDNVRLLGARFHAVYTAEQAQAYKPRLQAFEYMFDQLGCNPKDIMHVSSSFRYDQHSATDAGIGVRVFVGRGHEPSSPFYRDVEIPHIGCLPAVVGL